MILQDKISCIGPSLAQHNKELSGPKCKVLAALMYTAVMNCTSIIVAKKKE